MKVTLAKALKEKSRLAGRLKRNFEILSQENSKISGSIRSFDLKALMAETMQMHAAIIRLKQIIAETNAPIAGRLAEMDEIKSIITQLNKIDVTEGIQARSYGETATFDVVFPGRRFCGMSKRCRKEEKPFRMNWMNSM
ncbi:MAG: hypothetical protein L6W00_25085 [Lentisphaeria bacterium]|nr:MAG: hypothetical protein L6W00_25085 [Lentisphaeria bacterium]